MTLKCLVAFLTLLVSPLVSSAAETGGVRGDSSAVAAARRLLDQVGGAQVWRARKLEVAERIYLASGEIRHLSIVRDLARPARLTEVSSPGRTYTNWVSPEEGWTRRDGVLSAMSAEKVAAELHGMHQEPYAIYHRLAHDDPGLRVELGDDGTLRLFDRDERLLSWFLLAPNGVLLGWGNFSDGAINLHFYGPLVDVGDANLPKFGVASNGSFRFEYLTAQLTNMALEPPDPGN